MLKFLLWPGAVIEFTPDWILSPPPVCEKDVEHVKPPLRFRFPEVCVKEGVVKGTATEEVAEVL